MYLKPLYRSHFNFKSTKKCVFSGFSNFSLLFCLTRTCLNILYMIWLITFALIFLCHVFWQFPCIFLPFINTMPQEQDYHELVKATFVSLEVKMLTAQVVSSKPVYHFEVPPWTIAPITFLVMLQDFFTVKLWDFNESCNFPIKNPVKWSYLVKGGGYRSGGLIGILHRYHIFLCYYSSNREINSEKLLSICY